MFAAVKKYVGNLNGKFIVSEQGQYTANVVSFDTEAEAVAHVAPKTGCPWKDRPDLMKRLEAVQNKNWSRDIMTFAGFMSTEAELEEYVLQKEKFA